MYRVIEDFISEWEFESEATLKIFNNLTDEVLDQKVKGYDRTLGALAWHIINSITHIGNRIHLDIYAVNSGTELPKGKQILIDAYKKTSDSLLMGVKNKWNNEILLIEQDLFGEKWSNGRTLSLIIGHQAHHRAQLSVLMRILGLVVPGVYGPSKDDWVQLGKEPQK